MVDRSAHDAMLEAGEQRDPIREALRRMLAEFGDQHYHTCPANDDGPCDCFAGALNAEVRKVFESTPDTAEVVVDGTISETDKLQCVERELGYRRRVYLRLVNTGKMSPEAARREIFLMEAIVEDYRVRAESERLL